MAARKRISPLEGAVLVASLGAVAYAGYRIYQSEYAAPTGVTTGGDRPPGVPQTNPAPSTKTNGWDFLAGASSAAADIAAALK